MIAYFIALYSFFCVGWDTWDFEAFNPFSTFTREGLGPILAQTHSVYWISLGLTTLAFLLPKIFKKSRAALTAADFSLIAAFALALLPSFSGATKVDIGMGGFLYFITLLLILGHNLSRRGWLSGDYFSVQTILCFSALILIFIFFPILSMLKAAFITDAGIGFWHIFERLKAYGVLSTVYFNTLKLSIVVSIFSTLIGLAFALVIVRSKHKKLQGLFKNFSMLPMITPPFVIGLSLIYLFGRAGLITNNLLHIESNYLVGLPGLALAQILAFTPLSCMLITGVLEGIDPTMEEASFALRGGYYHTFRNVTWKLLRPALANAFLLTMIESFADFANPIIIGGDFHVLSTEIYFAVIGQFNAGLAASLAIVLLVSTLVFFFLQRLWLGKKSYVTISGKPQARILPSIPSVLDNLLVGCCTLWSLFTLALYLFFFYGGFVKVWGIDNTFTLDHYRQFMIDGWDSFQTTIWLALLSAPFTAVIGLLIAYVTQRKKFFGRSVLEFVSLLAFAIPGTVVGIGYLLAFHGSPFNMTGTAMILVFCFVFRNMPVGQRAGVALFAQIDRSLEDASLTLRATTTTTLRKIIFPLAEGAVLTAMITSFIRAVTAISAVVFLVSAKYNLATKVILDRIEYGRLGVATAYCTILVVFMVVVILVTNGITHRLSGRRMRTFEEPTVPLGETYA